MQSKNIKNLIWYSVPFLFKYILPIISFPIFTRFLTKYDFGVYALSIFYGTFGAGLINLGLLNIYERNFFSLDKESRKNLLLTILSFTLINSFFLIGVTHAFSNYIAFNIFRNNNIQSLLTVSLSFQIFKSFNQYFYVYFKNYENAKYYTFLSIIESSISIFISLILVVSFSLGIYGFILGQFLGSFIVFICSFCYLIITSKIKISKDILVEQLKLSLPLTPRVFFGVINTQFDRYMLGLLGSIGGVGLYDISQKIANIGFSSMTIVQNVYSPQVYKFFFSKNKNVSKSIGKYLTPFFYISILPCLLIGVFAYEILFILTTEEYYEAAPIITILSLLYGLYFFGKQPQLLFAKKTRLISALSFFSMSLNICLNIPMIKLYGIYGAALATTIAGSLSTIMSLYFGQKYAKISYENSVWFLLIYYILAVVSVSIFLSNELSIINFGLKMLIVVIFIFIGLKFNIINHDIPKSIFKSSK